MDESINRKKNIFLNEAIFIEDLVLHISTYAEISFSEQHFSYRKCISPHQYLCSKVRNSKSANRCVIKQKN